MTTLTMFMRFVQWPWALPIVIILPIVAAWLVRWGLRARGERLKRLGTPSMIARLAPAIRTDHPWTRVLRAALVALFLAIAII